MIIEDKIKNDIIAGLIEKGVSKKWIKKHFDLKVLPGISKETKKKIINNMNKNNNMKKITKLQVGDILSSSWGYEQTNVDFYQVQRLAGKTMVEVVKVENQIVDYNETSDYVKPYTANKGSKIYRRKIQGADTERPYINISTFQFARLWDGTPQRQTNAYYGH